MAQFQSGDVFQEYTYPLPVYEFDLGSKREGLEDMRAGSLRERHLEIGSLKGATRAEVAIEYWSGHVGTGGHQFRVNGNHWLDLPHPENTLTRPERYHHNMLGNPAVPIPLEHLRPGVNSFQFRTGPQIAYDMDWGLYWVYAFTLRVYQEPTEGHPSGEIVAPMQGATIGDHPTLSAAARGPHAAISSVDFVGHYEDYDWEGDGVYRKWHYQYQLGNIRHHLGSAFQPPYEVTWDTTWVPDQEEPVALMARVADSRGFTSITPEVSVKLARANRRVSMSKAKDVPEGFFSRVGQRKECTIDVTDSLTGAQEARLSLSTWCGAHCDEIGLNGTRLVERVGAVHHYSYDLIPVPIELIKTGANVFHILSHTEEHAIEVNWPGPALLVSY